MILLGLFDCVLGGAMSKLDFGWAVQEDATDAVGTASMSLRHSRVADLVLPSGAIIACDPLVAPETEPFAIAVPPGRYPVML